MDRVQALWGRGEDYYNHVDERGHGLIASLTEDGDLDLATTRPNDDPSFPRGYQMFDEAIDVFGLSNIERIRGTWIGGGEMAANYDEFYANLAHGMIPEEAAADTFTGRNAARYGFGEIESLEVNESLNKVNVVFGRG